MKATFPEFNNKYPVKERIFIYYMLFFTVLPLITVLANIIYGLDFSFNYKWLAISAFSITLLIVALKQVKIKIVHRIGIYCMLLIILPLGWISSSGLVSPSIIYSILLLIFINYLTNGIERIILNLLEIAIHIFLITLYAFHPEIFKTMSANEQILDWVINVPIVFVFIAILLITFEKAYESERSKNEEKSKQLNHLYQTDYLTGLYNRISLNDKLSFIHNACKRADQPYSVIIMDIDHFKEYNDHYGHLKGDQCLQQLGHILKESVSRNTDWLYRYGGEEFLAILGFTDKQGARIIANQIQKKLEEAAIPHLKSKVVSRITVSMGIATIQKTMQDPNVLLKYADDALYRSKKNGRNRICHFDDQVCCQET